MNSLSWMLYLAEVVGSAKVLAGAGIAACGLWFAGCLIGAVHAADFGDDDDIKPRRALALKALPVAASLAVFLVFVPSTSTVYAIAASEMGETALRSNTAGKALKALDAWLDRQIAGEADLK